MKIVLVTLKKGATKINRSNYQYKVEIKKEDEDKIPVLKKETIQKCKEILKKYKDTKTVIGVPSGDYESFCFDVPEEEYDRIEKDIIDVMGAEWKDLSKSCFYKDLYRVHEVPDVPIWRKLKKKGITHLLKVEYNDYGIISIEETYIPVEKIN